MAANHGTWIIVVLIDFVLRGGRACMRRALGLPFDAHSFLIPSLSCMLSLFDSA